MSRRDYLMLSVSPHALHGCGIPGSNAIEFQPISVRPPVIDAPAEPKS